MVHPSHRTARFFTIRPMSNGLFDTSSTPYTAIRRPGLRSWMMPNKPSPNFRQLHRSESQLSIKSIPAVSKVTKSAAALPDKPSVPQTSIIAAIGTIRWSELLRDCRNRCTAANAFALLRNLPSNTVAAYTVVINSREYDIARTLVIRSWQMSVLLVRTAYIWLGLFLESREYFYLRYYTLLTVERAIGWLRFGLQAAFDALRNWASKK